MLSMQRGQSEGQTNIINSLFKLLENVSKPFLHFSSNLHLMLQVELLKLTKQAFRVVTIVLQNGVIHIGIQQINYFCNQLPEWLVVILLSRDVLLAHVLNCLPEHQTKVIIIEDLGNQIYLIFRLQSLALLVLTYHFVKRTVIQLETHLDKNIISILNILLLMRLRGFTGSSANNSTSRPQLNQDGNRYRNQEKYSGTEGQKLVQRDVGGFKSKALDEQRQLQKYFQSLKTQIANLEEEMIKGIEVNNHEQMITAQKMKNKNVTDTFSETNDMMMNQNEKMQRNVTKIEGQINKILKNLRAKLLGKNEHRKNDWNRDQPKYNKNYETRRQNRHNNRQQKDRNRQKKIVDEEKVEEKSQRSFKQIGDPILLRNAPKEGHFSLKIKIEEVIRVLEGKEGPRLLIKVSDSSGSGEFIAGRSPLLLEGNVILVTNCFVFYHTGKNKITKKQISMRKNGTITVVKEEDDKRGKIEDISQSKFFRKEIKQTVTQINDIEPGEQGYFLKAKVYKILNRNKNKITCMLGDESGMVNAELPQKEIIREGEILELRSINAEVIKERILMTTNANSTITLSKGEIVRLRLDNDISMRLYEEDDS